MKLKILGFALLAVCVCAVCCMCGSDSKTPDYEFPDGPILIPTLNRAIILPD